jgi:PleD family two-component response regulator
MSVGIVRYDPEHPCSVEEFLAMADKAMYLCKKERKNLGPDSADGGSATAS